MTQHQPTTSGCNAPARLPVCCSQSCLFHPLLQLSLLQDAHKLTQHQRACLLHPVLNYFLPPVQLPLLQDARKLTRAFKTPASAAPEKNARSALAACLCDTSCPDFLLLPLLLSLLQDARTLTQHLTCTHAQRPSRLRC